MSSEFTWAKTSVWRVGDGGWAPRFHRFVPPVPRSGRWFSCRGQTDQPFQVPTDAFELQFQAVGFMAHIPHAPVARAALPPAKHFLNLTTDRTEQPVGADRRRSQLLPTARFAQDPVRHTLPPAPFAPGPAPIRLV